MRLRRTLLLLILLASLLGAQSPAKRQVLVLSSDHKGSPWTDVIVKGIESVLQGEPTVYTEVEYMDTKRTVDPYYMEKLYELYQYKFMKRNFDLLISTDNESLDFLIQYRNILFPGAPIVFCGVSNFDASVVKEMGFLSGILENFSLQENLEMALKLHPKAEYVAVVTDLSATGLANKERIEGIIGKISRKMEFLFFENSDIENVQKLIAEKGSRGILLLLSPLRDRFGNYVPVREVSSLGLPLYSLWDIFLGEGIIGGKLLSPYYQGVMAAEMGFQVLNGEKISEVPPIVQSADRYTFDYEELKRFHVDIRSLPQPNTLINTPFSFYEEYRSLVWTVLAAIGGLTVVIFVLLVNILQKRRTQKALQYRLKLEALISKVSTRFLEVGEEGLEEALRFTLQEIGLFWQIRWTGIHFFHSPPTLPREICWKAGEGEAVLFPFPLPWLFEKMQEGKLLSLTREDLPAEANREKRWMERENLLSFRAVPLVYGSTVQGFLILLAADGERGWGGDEDRHPLSMMAETLVSAYERTRAERERTEERRSLETLMSNLPGMVYRCKNDDVWSLEFLSEGCSELTGYSPAELVGKPGLSNWDLAFEEDRPEMEREIRDALQEGRPFRMAYRIRRKDGEERWVWEQGREMTDRRGGVTAVEGFATDITDKKRSEELAQLQEQKLMQTDKMASLGILVSGIAHEINNPNNFIQLNAKIFARVWEDLRSILDEYCEREGDFLLAGNPYSTSQERVTELIEGVAQGSERIKKIVNSLKDYSRKDSGKLNQSVNLNEVAESAVTIVFNLVKKSTRHFSVHLQDGLPPVMGNFQQLEQVVINLITNSCQALSSPDEEVELSTFYEEGRVKLRVWDQGSGITGESMKHIFDPFYTTKRETGGTGLGLSISYNILKNHGGELIFDSEPGRGTSAIISLPPFRLEKKDPEEENQ